MHLFVPLEPRYTYEQVRSFAELLCGAGGAERPDLFTTPRAVSRGKKAKCISIGRRSRKARRSPRLTCCGPYPGAPVATPLAWREVTPRLDPAQFNIANALARFDRVGDLFEGVLKRPQRMERALERLAATIRRKPA